VAEAQRGRGRFTAENLFLTLISKDLLADVRSQGILLR